MADMLGEYNPDFRGYLQSLCNDNRYRNWQNLYTSTDALNRQHTEDRIFRPQHFSFELLVQTLQPPQQSRQTAEPKREKIERLSVLDGLRKYATNHVLLVGQPGSGKSTALERLLWEEAQKCTEEEQESAKIPILVELRYYSTSVLDLIRDFLIEHCLPLEIKEIENLLIAGKFLLLIDGLNELPNDDARRNLNKFRQTYRFTPMIFTTRYLSLGGDLDIEKKLEMQALTSEQMQQFVRGYLPEQGEEMLRRLSERLQDFGNTPLLLLMLCNLFSEIGDIPANLGLVFFCFTESYNKKLWGKVKVSRKFRLLISELLQHLAFAMMEGEKPTESRLAIDRQAAEKVLEEFLQDKVNHPPTKAKMWLEDLLKHHLIQRASQDKIEFRHQLIQEYYAAGRLLQEVEKLSDDELQWDYLNYVKWTEPVALMLELMNNEALALRVVKLALQVDCQLGARLAGSVKLEWQQRTVDLINQLQIPQLFKLRLFGLTKSNSAISHLSEALSDSDNAIRRNAAKYFGEIASPQTISVLEKSLKDQDNEVRKITVESLSKVASDLVIPILVKALYDEYDEVRNIAAESLGKIGSDTAIPPLIRIIRCSRHDYIRTSAAYALVNIGTTGVVKAVIKYLIDSDNILIRRIAVQIIDYIGSRDAISALTQALKDSDTDVRINAACALGKLGLNIAIPIIKEYTESSNYDISYRAIYALGKVGSDTAINELFQLLNNPSYNIKQSAAMVLVNIGSKKIIARLIKYLKTEKSNVVREIIIKSLGEIGSTRAIPYLIRILKKNSGADDYVRKNAAQALGKIGSDDAIDSLIESLITDDYVREYAANSLGIIGSDTAILALNQALTSYDNKVRSAAAKAIIKIHSKTNSNNVLSELINAIDL
ncbi:HEAT repeat domain-containing protein [Nostoc sp. UIC 10607]|uniref:HEAT repeat domain-containing protein n=1 Tax=Nostoc sp. UIC 10607 TaxID=3045935 RepID=UPI00399FF255